MKNKITTYGQTYPGCGAGEYYTPNYGCVPFAGMGGQRTSCTTLKLTISARKPDDGGSTACVPSPSNCYCDTPCP